MKRYFVFDKKLKAVMEVSLNIFLACFGELPEEGTQLENDYCIGRVEE